MFNVLLDKLPTDYMGYPIDADFQTGIQILQALEDRELTKQEKIEEALSLLFLDEDEDGNPLELPDIDTALDGLEWFLGGWNHDNPDKSNDKTKVMDYDIDQWRIYSAFRQQYNINLNTDQLHFWEFMGLLHTLEECAHTRVINIRSEKIDAKADPKEKERIREAKKVYSLGQQEEIDPKTAEAANRFKNQMKRK